jgi:2-dehydropantoate 2-reductase
MRIAVIGAGAVGSAIGALLTRAGHDCVLVARPDHRAAIRAGGLRLTGCLGPVTVDVEAVDRIRSAPDLALLTTKAHDAAAAMAANRAGLAGAPQLLAPNGIRGVDLASQFCRPEQVAGAVVMMAATHLRPGAVDLPYLGSLVLGRATGPPDAMVATIASVLDHAIPTATTGNFRGAQWTKLLLNLNNALAAVTGLDDRGLLATPPLLRAGVALMREGLRVADATGVRLASLPGVPAAMVRAAGWLPAPACAQLARYRAGRLALAGPVIPSTLQSLRRGRPTEIDYLNGEVARAGRQAGVPALLNERVVHLVHEVARRGRPYPPDEVLALLRPVTMPGGAGSGDTRENHHERTD